MALKIRLTRLGDKKAPFYRVVVADSRSPRDGKFVEVLGTFNPLTDPAEIKIDNERAAEWIKNGAVAVGAGGALTGGAKTGDYASITRIGREFIEKIKEARAK